MLTRELPVERAAPAPGRAGLPAFWEPPGPARGGLNEVIGAGIGRCGTSCRGGGEEGERNSGQRGRTNKGQEAGACEVTGVQVQGCRQRAVGLLTWLPLHGSRCWDTTAVWFGVTNTLRQLHSGAHLTLRWGPRAVPGEQRVFTEQGCCA